jgi:hypothetical protein
MVFPQEKQNLSGNQKVTKNLPSRYPRASPWHFFKIQGLLDALRASSHSPTAKAVELCPSGYKKQQTPVKAELSEE